MNNNAFWYEDPHSGLSLVESSECAHVSINKVACYRTERTLVGCADCPERAHPISVLELTNNEVVGGSRHWPSRPEMSEYFFCTLVEGGAAMLMYVAAEDAHCCCFRPNAIVFKFFLLPYLDL